MCQRLHGLCFFLREFALGPNTCFSFKPGRLTAVWEDDWGMRTPTHAKTHTRWQAHTLHYLSSQWEFSDCSHTGHPSLILFPTICLECQSKCKGMIWKQSFSHTVAHGIIAITAGNKASNWVFIFSIIDCDEWITNPCCSSYLIMCAFLLGCVYICRYVRNRAKTKTVYLFECITWKVCVFPDVWILCAILSTGSTDSLCFISRLVCDAQSGTPQSPIICCQIFINVTELRPPTNGCWLVGLLKVLKMNIVIHKN